MTGSNKGRFPAGRSGNPNGRPRKNAKISGVTEADKAILKASRQPVILTQNGKRKRVKMLEANVVQTFAQGAGGDLRAADKAVGMTIKAYERAGNQPEEPGLTATDQEIAAAFIERLERFLPLKPRAEEPETGGEGEGE